MFGLSESKEVGSTVWQIVKLAIPLFLSSASWVSEKLTFSLPFVYYIPPSPQVGMKATDTALLGHLAEEGTLYLSAVAVADLWTSSTGVFIQGRVLGTFVGQAVGAGKPAMAGVWLQVSLACLAPLAIVPLILWTTLTSWLYNSVELSKVARQSVCCHADFCDATTFVVLNISIRIPVFSNMKHQSNYIIMT